MHFETLGEQMKSKEVRARVWESGLAIWKVLRKTDRKPGETDYPWVFTWNVFLVISRGVA